jgi:hypothetical protein
VPTAREKRERGAAKARKKRSSGRVKAESKRAKSVAKTKTAPEARGQASLRQFIRKQDVKERVERVGNRRTLEAAQPLSFEETYGVTRDEYVRRQDAVSAKMIAAAMLQTDPAAVVRESEKAFMGSQPRPRGSESSFAFVSKDDAGRKTVRFSDKPKARKGEKRKRFD